MKIAQVLEKSGLTKREFANRLGIGENYLWMILSGKRKISKLLQIKIDKLVADVIDKCQKPVENPPNPQNIESPPILHIPENSDLAVVPATHLEVVQENNNILEKIREDQERELELKRKQGRQISEALELLQGMDTVVQSRVRDIIDERTRTIIAMSNHHVHTQAQIMITALEGIINMLDAGLNNTAVFRKQLETVRQQLEKMAAFKQP